MYSRSFLGKDVCIADPTESFFQELVREDLKRSLHNIKLGIIPELHKPLIVQTVLGHAINGHGYFHSIAQFPFASITDIITAAGMDVEKTKETRQEIIDRFFEWLEIAKKDQTDRLMINGKPLMGVEFLTEMEYTIEPEYVLKGATLAGFMDNYDWRTKTMERFPKTIDGKKLRIGGGETYLIDPSKFTEWKFLGPEFLSEVEISEEKIQEMKEEKFFTSSENPNAEVAYVRRRKGWGTSDDTAFIVIGEMFKKYGQKAARSAMLGAFLVDAIDTYDKCVSRPIEGGYDEKVGRDLREALPDLISDNDITDLIYYCAKGNGEPTVSSSHKRLVQTINNVHPKMPTILHHLKFMETGTFGPFRIGFERQSNSVFYEEVSRRIKHYHENK